MVTRSERADEQKEELLFLGDRVVTIEEMTSE